jgi:uncharacterized protein (TIGR03086 family)
MADLDIRDLDRRAVQRSMQIVARATPADLTHPTPCEGWSLGDLLAHMTAQHRGFAAAAAGQGADLARWAVRPLGDDAVAAYTAAAEAVIAAFGTDDVLGRQFVLPELTAAQAFPARQAIGFHFIDYVVHAWDVARALGVPYTLDAEVAAPALRIAEAVPNGPERLRPGAAFRPALVEPSSTTPLDRILSMLGRSPAWPT